MEIEKEGEMLSIFVMTKKSAQKLQEDAGY